MYTDPLPAALEVRLYQADNTAWRLLSFAADGKPGVAPGLEARVTVTQGYGEATIPLLGVLADFPGLASGRKMELHARYVHPVTLLETTELLYRGYIRRADPEKNNGQWKVVVKCYGIWAELSKARCFKRYANSARADKNAIFSDLFTRFGQRGRLSGLSLLSLPVGDIPDYVDAYNTTLGDAADKLSQNTGRVVTGGDVEPTSGNDRARFVPFDDPSLSVRHVLSVPSPQAGSRARGEDATRQATVLHLTGGQMSRGRANLLAEAVEGNTSFEMPELAGESPVGSAVTNGSFEDGTGDAATGWTMSGGASAKSRTDDNVSPFNGDRYLKLDTVGEKATQTNNPPAVALVVGSQMILSCRARRYADGFSASGELRVVWLTAGGATISTEEVALAPTGTSFDLFSGMVTVPATAAGFRVEEECTALGGVGGQYALLIDEVMLYPQGAVTQRGWQFRVEGTAAFKVLRWDEDAVSWHGGRCVYAEVTGADTGENEAHIEPFGFNRFTAVGGQTITGGFVVKRAPGNTVNPVLQVNLTEWKQDGSKRGYDVGNLTLTTDDWVVISVTRAFAGDAAQGIVYLDFQSDAKVFVDGAFAFVGAVSPVDAATPDLFVEADQFQATLRAVDLFTTGNAIHDAAEDLGDLPESEERPEIKTLADAEAYARDYFTKYVPVIERPNLETFGILNTGGGSTASMWPGEYVRAIGEDGADLLPSPLPLVEKLIRWDGGNITITPYLQVEPRDPARTIAEIVRRDRRNGATGGGSSSSGGGLSGGGGSEDGGSGTGYAAVQEEGVALTQRTILNFLGGGVTAVDNAVTGATDVTVPAGSVVYGTTAGTAAEGNDARIVGAAQKSANLSDMADAATSRTNLGLGSAAVANTGTLSGNVPVLDGSGKLATGVLPALAITSTFVVASQAAMLALSAQEGDVAVRTDLNKSFILTTNSPGTLADWQELLTPTDSVQSVNGQVGVVTGLLEAANNLSDLGSAATGRTNLGLGTAATKNAPASGNAAAGEVVLGSDTRLSGGSGAPTMFAGKASVSRPATTGKDILATHQFFHIYYTGPTGSATATLHAANDANRVMPVTIRNDDTTAWNIDVLGSSTDVIYTGPGTASVTSYSLAAGYSVTLFPDNPGSTWAWYVLNKS